MLEGDVTGRKTLRISSPLKKVGKADRVFRVREAAARFVDDDQLPLIPVTGRVKLRLGQPLEVSFSTPDGTTGSFTGDVVEAARTKPVSQDDVRSHIDRMGNTPFAMREAQSLDMELDDGVGIGFSALHHARAEALGQLEEALAPTAPRKLPRAGGDSRPATAHPTGCLVAALAANPSCARAAKRAGADIIYVPALNYHRGTAVVGGQVSPTVEQAGYPKQAVMALPVAAHDALPGTREDAFGFDAMELVREGKPVLAENLGQLVESLAAGAQVEAGPHIPVLNRPALDALADLGVSRVWLSPELSLSQIAELSQGKTASLGLTVSGAAELMVTEHCLLMSQGPCNRNCTDCPRRKSPHFLRDRKGYEMPVVTDCCGRSHLYNAVKLDLTHLMPDLIKAGVDAVMVDATLLNVEETTAAVRRAVRARDVALKNGDALKKLDGGTTGHIFRGVE